MKIPLKRIFLILSAKSIPFLGIFFVSCSNDMSSQSFMKMMELSDSYIKNGEMTEAVKILKKSEKKAVTPISRMGIYKRYLVLGEEKLAEKIIQNALKKYPENLELNAVYGTYLLRKNRLDEAVQISAILEGTKYGSVHSEAVLKKLLAVKEDEASDVLYSRQISPVYYDIYATTDDVRWLRNCAMTYLLRGEYTRASDLQPETFADSEDALFWSYVQYDSGNYDIAVRNLPEVKSDLLRGAAASLASDAYMMMDDADGAEAARAEYMNRAKSFVKIGPALSVNSALWAYNHGEFKRAYDLLLDSLIEKPDFIPGLITYGRLAWEDSLPREITALEKAVRETELRTRAMREYDERPKFTISDAIYRMDQLIESDLENGKTANGDLIVERLSLYLKNNESLPLKTKTALIWAVLEKNQEGTNLYPAHLVQFAVQKLLSFGLFDDARNLFTNYITAKFFAEKTEEQQLMAKKIETDIFGGEKLVRMPVIPEAIAKLAFGDKAADCAEKMEIWEVEFAAFFALKDDNITAATRLYEYVLFETGGVKTANANGEIISVSPLAAPSSAANLGMIYSSRGYLKRALNLYTQAAGRTRSKVTKSRLLYRVAKIQEGSGRISDAKLSVAYSIALDPSNADARLLRTQLERRTEKKPEKKF